MFPLQSFRAPTCGAVLSILSWLIIATDLQAGSIVWDGSCGTSRWDACCAVDQLNSESNWALGQAPLQICSETLLPGLNDDLSIGRFAVVVTGEAPAVGRTLSSLGDFSIAGGILDIQEQAEFNGMLDCSSARLRTGTFISRGGMEMSVHSQGLTLEQNARLILESDGAMEGVATIRFAGGGQFTIGPDAVFEIRNNPTIIGTPSSNHYSIEVMGTLRKTSGAGTTLITLPCTGSAGEDCGLNNDGLVDVRTGTLQIRTNGRHSGEFLIESGATLKFESTGVTQYLADGARFSGEGALNLTGGRLSIADGSRAFISSEMTGWCQVLGGGELVIEHSLTADPSLQLTNSQLIVESDAVAETKALIVTSGRVDVRGVLSIPGLMNISGTSVIDVESEGVLDISPAGGVSASALPPTVFNVAGVLRKNGTVQRLLGTALNNVGRVEVGMGTLGLYNGGRHSGEFMIQPTGLLEFRNLNDMHVLQDGARLFGGGMVRFNQTLVEEDATVRFESLSIYAMNLTIEGTIDIFGNCTFAPQASLVGGGEIHVRPEANLLIDGIAILDRPTMINDGTVELPQSRSMYVRSGARFLNSTAGTLKCSGNVLVQLSTSQLINEGMIQTKGQPVATLSGAVQNLGAIESLEGRLQVTSEFSQAGAGQILLHGGSLETLNDGALTLAGGQLAGHGTVRSSHLFNTGATLAPEGGMKLTGVQIGHYTQGPAAALEIDIAGSEAQTGYDVLKVSGTANLGGTLRIIRANGFTPGPGEVYTFLECGNRVGEFSSVVLENFPKGSAASLKYYPNRVLLAVRIP